MSNEICSKEIKSLKAQLQVQHTLLFEAVCLSVKFLGPQAKGALDA